MKFHILNKTQKFNCCIYTGWAFLALNLSWMLVEKLIYGEVQSRIVDNIISVPILVIIYYLFKFKKERDILIEKMLDEIKE